MTHMWIRIFSIIVVLWASQICGAQSLIDHSNMLLDRIDFFDYNMQIGQVKLQLCFLLQTI